MAMTHIHLLTMNPGMLRSPSVRDLPGTRAWVIFSTSSTLPIQGDFKVTSR